MQAAEAYGAVCCFSGVWSIHVYGLLLFFYWIAYVLCDVGGKQEGGGRCKCVFMFIPFA